MQYILKGITLYAVILIIFWVIREDFPKVGMDTNYELARSAENKSMANTLINAVPRTMHINTYEHIVVANPTQCKHRQLLVYKCGKHKCAGWGNRVRGIVTSFLLALLTNRAFVIDMTNPCDVSLFLKPNVYNWSTCLTYIRTEVKEDDMKFLNLKGQSLDTIIQSVQALQNTPVIHILINTDGNIDQWSNYIEDHRNMKWLLESTESEVYHLSIHTLFAPNNRLSLQLDIFSHEQIYGKQLVCAHIRKGQNPSMPKDGVRKYSPDESTILSYLRKYDNENKYTIYIASDSEKVKALAISELGNVIITNRTIFHVDRIDNDIDVNTACEGFYTVLLEVYILASCDTLLLTHSSFGLIAAYMRGSTRNLFMYKQQTDTIEKAGLLFF